MWLRGLVLSGMLAGSAAAQPACLAGLPHEPAGLLAVEVPLTLQRGAEALRLTGLAPFAGDEGVALADTLRAQTGEGLFVTRLPLSDRYGRPLVHLWRGETLVAAALVRQGLARALSEPSDPCAASLRVAEGEALVSAAGLWAGKVVEARDSRRLTAQTGRFAAVSGVVQSVRSLKTITYVNFGRRGENALTAVLRTRGMERLRKAGVETAALKGQKVLVSGVVVWRNGPQIVIETAEQLVVPPPTGPRPTEQK